MTPSTYQQAIYDAVPSHPRGFAVVAVAGSGKTTTLVELAKHLPRHHVNVFLAFNVKIADTLKERLPYWTQPSTFHSFCKKQLQGKVKPRKLSDLMDDFSYDLLQAVGLAKANLTSLDPQPLEFYIATCEAADSDADPREVKRLCELSLRDRTTMDFDDMLCFALEATFPKVHTLCIDEAQDLSPVQHAIIKRINPDRLIVVGDPAQAIYGFRGAASDSMSLLTREFALPTFPLSICYRCATKIIDYANTHN
jgi:DNA helicase-2/ATP-dependent DNA helicase PcrA